MQTKYCSHTDSHMYRHVPTYIHMYIHIYNIPTPVRICMQNNKHWSLLRIIFRIFFFFFFVRMVSQVTWVTYKKCLNYEEMNINMKSESFPGGACIEEWELWLFISIPKGQHLKKVRFQNPTADYHFFKLIFPLHLQRTRFCIY